MSAQVVYGEVLVGGGVQLLARVTGRDGTPVTRASIASITYAVRDLTDATTDTTGTLTVSSVIYDEMQVDDPRWTRDSAEKPGRDGRFGFNFLAELASTVFTEFDVETEEYFDQGFDVLAHDYLCRVTFTPVSGQPFVLAYRITLVPTWAS